jgi:hypothetical protein
MEWSSRRVLVVDQPSCDPSRGCTKVSRSGAEEDRTRAGPLDAADERTGKSTIHGTRRGKSGRVYYYPSMLYLEPIMMSFVILDLFRHGSCGGILTCCET